MSVYNFSVVTIDGEEKSLSSYKGKVLLIVNTASKCGFTSQYEGLQKLYNQYKSQGFEILGFPSNQFMNQEPGTEKDIEAFCQLNYDVTFPLFSKINVRGSHIHPLYRYLTKEMPGIMSKHIKWNFTKFIVNRNGKVTGRYAPQTKPEQLEKGIKQALEQ